jgi:caa(3)-type oxidase subunit IV
MVKENRVDERKRVAYRQGVMVFLALAVLTGAEYLMSQVGLTSGFLFFAVALVKAGLIAYYFMHIFRLWREESH